MCLDVYIERLRLQLRVWRVVHARNDLRRSQVMQVRRQLVEFCARRLLLKLGFLEGGFPSKLLQLLTDLVVLRLDVLEIALPSVEVVLVFPAVEATVILLNDLGLLVEELRLLVLVFQLLPLHELATAQVTAPDPLNLPDRPPNAVILPFRLQHVPGLLNHHRRSCLLVAMLFGLIQSGIVVVDETLVSLLPFPEEGCHLL